MIEIFNVERSNSFGCFVNFKVAKDTLNELAVSKQLGENPAVLVCSYRNNEPQREYVATYSLGKWHVPSMPKVSHSTTQEVGRKRSRKKRLCKEYKSPEACFNEGFPDWLNRLYPVPVCKQQGLNVRLRANA